MPRDPFDVSAVSLARGAYPYNLDAETNVDFQDALVKFVNDRLPALLREATVSVWRMGHVVQFYEKFVAFVAAAGDDMREGPQVYETLHAVTVVNDVGDVITIAVRPKAAVSADVRVRTDNVGDANVEGDSETEGTNEIDRGMKDNLRMLRLMIKRKRDDEAKTVMAWLKLRADVFHDALTKRKRKNVHVVVR